MELQIQNIQIKAICYDVSLIIVVKIIKLKVKKLFIASEIKIKN